MSVVTEDDALAMLCPRLAQALNGNRHCVGRNCMSWRWATLARHGFVYPQPSLQRAQHDAQGKGGRGAQTVVGYCGEAGRPS